MATSTDKPASPAQDALVELKGKPVPRPPFLRELRDKVAVTVVASIIIGAIAILPFRWAVDYIANRLGAVPIGTILAWNGHGSPPDGWEICNGLNNTPDLKGRFLCGVTDETEAGALRGTYLNTIENDVVKGLAGQPAVKVADLPGDSVGATVNIPPNYTVRYIIRVK